MTKPPYGSEECFSGLYVAIACLNSGLDCGILFMGDGVYATIANQDPKGLSMPSVSDLIYTLLPESRLYAHEESLRERMLPASSMIKGIRLVGDSEMAELVLECGEYILTF
ncbi:MAG: DsrE family protein [Candidatus Freyarchaeota archaeon]